MSEENKTSTAVKTAITLGVGALIGAATYYAVDALMKDDEPVRPHRSRPSRPRTSE